jgi:hypothetical protein
LLRRAIALLLLSAAFACKDPPPGADSKAPDPAAAKPDQKIEAPPGAPDFASAFKHSERWDPAKKAVVVELTVSPGYHAYTTGESTGKPLLVEIAADSDLVSAGDVEYPKGTEKNLPIGRSVIVEGNAHIYAPVAPKPGAVEGPKKAKGTLRYQVCTEKVCDRPRTVPIAVDVPST